MLAQSGDLTLVSLGGPSGERKVGEEIAAICRNVIEPGVGWRKKPGKKPSRIQAWKRILLVLIFPWRNNWREFHLYCIQYLKESKGETDPLVDWRKRFIRTVLKMQYTLGVRLFHMPPRSMFAYSDKFDAIRERAAAALDNGTYDMIWYEHTHVYPFVVALLKSINRSVPESLVCNAHNVEWLLSERMGMVAASNWESEDLRLQARVIARAEKEQFNACDLVFVCSQEDKQAVRALAPVPCVAVVGNGVDTIYFRPGGAEPKSTDPTMLFTGTFGYEPNLDALRYFIEEIFPLITKERPECRFIFAGRDAQRAFDELQINNVGISCVSNPSDIRPCFQQAWVFVAPLRSGGGTRLKIFEAMSMECPVVSTSVGAEGIPAEDGRHLLLADSPAEFARQVIRLLETPTLRARLAHAASEWVHENYDWGMLVQQATKELAALNLRRSRGQK